MNEVSVFSSKDSFENGQRMAIMLSKAAMVPDTYKGEQNIGNALIALDMSNRLGVAPLTVMQNLHIIHGRPSLASSFLIAMMNANGRFSPLRFEYFEDGEITHAGKKVVNRGCRATCTGKDGKDLVGPEVTIQMAIAEGWYSKTGSKWPNMPQLMLSYRAAAFFVRLYAPDVALGLQTDDEIKDIAPPEIFGKDDFNAQEIASAPSAQSEPPKTTTKQKKTVKVTTETVIEAQIVPVTEPEKPVAIPTLADESDDLFPED